MTATVNGTPVQNPMLSKVSLTEKELRVGYVLDLRKGSHEDSMLH